MRYRTISFQEWPSEAQVGVERAATERMLAAEGSGEVIVGQRIDERLWSPDEEDLAEDPSIQPAKYYTLTIQVGSPDWRI